MIVNLYSDTVTIPTPAMLKAMLKAPVGDDVSHSDPTVKALQKKLAALFKMEAALFFPSGTMANQAAIKLHTQPGDKLFCHRDSHVHNYESGGIAFHSGVTTATLTGERGIFTPEQLEEAILSRNDIHVSEPKIVVIENTTNLGGGACWDINQLKKISHLCRKNKLVLHLDGARIFNALVEKNHSAKDYGKIFDTISVCLSKGLGSPIGSVLIGRKEKIKSALKVRKRMGGGMRQVGYLAAAGIYALDNHVERLKEDHLRAQELAEILKLSSCIKKVMPVETNIVIFFLQDKDKERIFLQKLKREKVYISALGNGKLRMVTHLGITNSMIEKIKKIIKEKFT